MNRLTQASTTTWGDSYGYDAWGNLLSKTPLSGLTGESMSYTMTTNNQFTPPNGSLLAYDKAGEMTVDNSGNAYTYDNEGRVTQVNNGSYVTTYQYDANGLRVGKVSTQAGKLYWYDPNGKLLNESDTSGNVSDRFGWFNGEMIGRLDSSGNVLHFIYHDHLGSARVTVSSAGTVQDDLDYYPFGTVIPKQFTSGNEYQFTGYETDTESNTEHAWFRNLSSGLGRYMRPDPYAVSYDVTDPQSMNRYSYVNNRVSLFTDQFGLEEGYCVDTGDGGVSCTYVMDPTWTAMTDPSENPGDSFPGVGENGPITGAGTDEDPSGIAGWAWTQPDGWGMAGVMVGVPMSSQIGGGSVWTGARIGPTPTTTQPSMTGDPACYGAPDAVSDIHQLMRGNLFNAPAASTDGAYGQSVWQNTTQGSQPYGNYGANAGFTGFFLGMDYALSVANCLQGN